MEDNFKGKRVVITGGTSGIGQACVKAFAQQGARTAFCARGRERGEALAAELSAQGLSVRYIACDVSQEEQVAGMEELLRTSWGGLDYAVNCAGMSPRRSALADTPLATFEEVMSVNVKGLFLSLRSEIKLMGEGSSIVNIASILGLKAMNLGHAAYTASKHAALGLTKTAALETAGKGIRINAICPGGIDTPIHGLNSASDEAKAAMARLHPLARMGRPEEVSQLALFLCGEGATFITGATIAVDGGICAG